MFKTLKFVTIFLLFLNAAVGITSFLITGQVPYANLIGMMFAAVGLSILDNRDKSEED
jgi:hypothetical protein